jgi:hypothetical protein
MLLLHLLLGIGRQDAHNIQSPIIPKDGAAGISLERSMIIPGLILVSVVGTVML